MPIQSTVLGSPGVKWGGVSERPSRVIEESDLFALTRRRNGGRRPGLPDDGSLRGGPLERRSRSVRPVCRVSSLQSYAPATTDVRRTPEEGNVVGPTLSMRRHPSRGSTDLSRSGDASFARSFDSCSSILTELSPAEPRKWCKLSGGEAGGPASRSGKPAQAGGTGTGVGSNGRCATRLVSTLVHNGPAGHDEEAEGGCGLRPRETRELRFGSPHVVRCCRNRQATPGLEYARQTRPKKDGQGRVNRGLARDGFWRVKASAVVSGEKADRESDSPETKRRVSAQGPR